MQAETSPKVQRWEREPANIPIKLVLRAETFKSDSMATTLDLSLHGMKVQTSLFLVPGEWVGNRPQRGISAGHPRTRRLGARG